MKKIYLIYTVIILFSGVLKAEKFTRQDSLRGGNGTGRNWWDVIQYSLQVKIDTPACKYACNSVAIDFLATADGHDSMQIDLQQPMTLDTAYLAAGLGKGIAPLLQREKNVYWLLFPHATFQKGNRYTLRLLFSGTPRAAITPPWDGGFINTKDSFGHPWQAVACQGLGASCWWPCKDYQGDEPDSGMTVSITTASNSYTAISNGRLISHTQNPPSDNHLPFPETTIDQNGNVKTNTDIVFTPKPAAQTATWRVTNPINTYNATFYYGNYAHWQDTIMGEKGKLDLNFYPLAGNLEKSREHFKVVKQMLHCFEYWMGPYPFYEDGYKLAEAPYLGMEHQSAIAYGNLYKMGYLGRDRSGTGVGMSFDYIIVHESGHEWFGNNISAGDIADNWLHEGFTTYTETLFAEWIAGKEKAFAYCRGEWQNIRNDKPIIGVYGVQNEGSSDEYDKGAAILHMIRATLNNDTLFRSLLRALNKEYYHGIVTTAAVETFISNYTHTDFHLFFDQYLRTTKIPVLEYKLKKGKLRYRFTNVVKGFSMPIPANTGDLPTTITVTEKWQSIPWEYGYNINFSKDFLIKIKN